MNRASEAEARDQKTRPNRETREPHQVKGRSGRKRDGRREERGVRIGRVEGKKVKRTRQGRETQTRIDEKKRRTL